jgi:hypothetical protein
LLIYYVHSKGLPFGILPVVYYYVHSSPTGSALFQCTRKNKHYDVRGSVFLDVGYRARCCFSIGLKGLSSWRFNGKGLFSGFIVSHAIVKLFRVGYRLLFSTYNDVIVFLYGMVRHGSK